MTDAELIASLWGDDPQSDARGKTMDDIPCGQPTLKDMEWVLNEALKPGPVSTTATVAFEEALCMAALGARTFAEQVPAGMSAAEALRQFADKLWPQGGSPAGRPLPPPTPRVVWASPPDTGDNGRIRLCAARGGVEE